MSDACVDMCIEVAERAREAALEELGAALRHELSTLAHVARAALESCERGDVEKGTRRLSAVCERSDRLRAILEAYARGARDGVPPVTTLGEVQHELTLLVGRRALADGGAMPEVRIDPGAAALPLALPRPALMLVMAELVRAFGARVVDVRCADGTCSVHGTVTGGAFGALVVDAEGRRDPDALTLGWLARTLTRHGGALERSPGGAVIVRAPLARHDLEGKGRA
jgi:hypothetical protein